MTNNRIYYNDCIININSPIYETHKTKMCSKKSIEKVICGEIIKFKRDMFKQLPKLITERIKTYENYKIGLIFEDNISGIY